MLKEIWIKTNEMNMRLPIAHPEFERLTSASYDDESVLGLGDVAIYKSNGLAKISIESFFPNHNYSFNAYGDVWKVYDYVKWMKKWKNEGTVVRVIYTGTDINQLMTLRDFNYGEKNASGDVHYTADFIEHREIKIPKLSSNNNNGNNSNNSNSNNNNNRPVEKPPVSTQKTHIVGKGDSLWSLAKKYYGKGSLWKKIADANVKTYPSLKNNPNFIRDGWKLVIP